VDSELQISLGERKEKCKPLVLIVDDDPIHHKLLELLADRLGIMVCLTSSCAEAVEAIRTFSFDVILMDCRMPEVDGYMCTKRIRELTANTKSIPIIAVTANVAQENHEKCMACGMNDFLPKPFLLEELQEKLRLWLKKNEE